MHGASVTSVMGTARGNNLCKKLLRQKRCVIKANHDTQ